MQILDSMGADKSTPEKMILELSLYLYATSLNIRIGGASFSTWNIKKIVKNSELKLLYISPLGI